MKQIPRFSNYCITKGGKVWSKPRHGKWLKPYKQKNGYLTVNLQDKNKGNISISRLVLETFVGPCPEGMKCRHLNGDRQDNRLENLCWGTRSDNQKDAIRHGTASCLKRKGHNSNFAKLTENQVKLIFCAYHDGAYTQQELADCFGVGQGCIQAIVTKKNWGHLWDE